VSSDVVSTGVVGRQNQLARLRTLIDRVPVQGQVLVVPIAGGQQRVEIQWTVKNAAGEVVELRCTYDPATKGGNAPDGRKVQATLHWVAAADAVPAEIRLYSHLFNRPDPGAEGDALTDLNPQSLEVLTGALVESALVDTAVGVAVQFERTGYFAMDSDSRPGRPVFNRTVALRDTWAKVQAKA